MSDAAPLPVLPVEVRSMVTRDGVRLDADIYRPATGGPYPVLLQRQAYGRRIACTICYAHPAWYAAQGYVVVVQDVRGRGTSEGVFRPGEKEMSDGAEAIAWAAALEGTTGDVGMYGFSYQAFNQMLAAAGDSPALKAMAPAMGPWDVARSWAFENGALRMKQMVGWGIQITAEGARRAGDIAAYTELAAANQTLPVRGPVAARPDVLMRHRHLSHAADWLETPADAAYWATISPSTYAATLKARRLPMLFIGGWFDTHLGSTLSAYRALAGEGAPIHLMVGPWLHFPWTRKVGALDFGAAAAFDTDRLQVAWFDHWLKNKGGGTPPVLPVRLFDMGAKTWRDYPTWNEASRQLYPAGDGRSSIDLEAGGLVEAPAAQIVTEYLVHDPWRPAPVTGGCYGVPPGPVDRTGTETRGDVLTFTTPPLTAPLTLAGTVRVVLDVGADRPSFDLDCVLSRVTVSGQSFQLAAGHCLIPAPGPSAPVALSLQGTCATLAAGERLRLSIATAAFPAFPVNPGTGEDSVSTPSAAAQITTLSLRLGANSRLELAVDP